MKSDVRYIVTKASDDGTFEIGDHIQLNDDGSISCIEAHGWIDAEDVNVVIIGMEYTIDTDYLSKKCTKLQNELDSLLGDVSKK